jgi:hypothetical protein
MMPTAAWIEILVEKLRQLPPRLVTDSIEALTTSRNSASRFDDTKNHGLDEGALMFPGKVNSGSSSWKSSRAMSCQPRCQIEIFAVSQEPTTAK